MLNYSFNVSLCRMQSGYDIMVIFLIVCLFVMYVSEVGDY